MTGVVATDPQNVMQNGEIRIKRTFFVTSAALIPQLLANFPDTANGSFALDLAGGVTQVLIDGMWVG